MTLAAKQTAMFGAVMAVMTTGAIHYSADAFRATENMRVAGGFACSLVFLWAMLCLGNMGGPVGWMHVGICMVLTMFLGSTVHPMCITTSFLFSCGFVYYLNWAANKK